VCPTRHGRVAYLVQEVLHGTHGRKVEDFDLQAQLLQRHSQHLRLLVLIQLRVLRPSEQVVAHACLCSTGAAFALCGAGT